MNTPGHLPPTITNNRPLAVGNGAIYMTNSPFMTSLLFVKSPLVTSYLSQQSGKPYFLQLLASIVKKAFCLLNDQAHLHQDIYFLLPVAKMMSLRILTMPDTFMESLQIASVKSIIKRPSTSMSKIIKESLEQSHEDFIDKKRKMNGGDVTESTTPVLKSSHSHSLLLSSSPPPSLFSSSSSLLSSSSTSSTFSKSLLSSSGSNAPHISFKQLDVGIDNVLGISIIGRITHR